MDFMDLGLLGWIGILIRTVYVLSIPLKPTWHFNYAERLFQIREVDKYVPDETTEYIYMGLRFVAISIVLFVVTGWMI